MDLKFQTSYTLDLLYFIDILLNGGASELEDDIEYFRSYLSVDGEDSLKFLHKTLKYGQSLQQLIAPLLVADEEFDKLSIGELLVSGRYLIKTYKQSHAYSKSGIAYQRFLQKEALLVIASLEPLVLDLEKGGFKNYWLTHQLPVLKNALCCFSDALDWKRLSQILGHWHRGKLNVYVSAFSNMDFGSYGNGHFTAAAETGSKRIAKTLAENTVEQIIAQVEWATVISAMPQKEEIKKVKAWGQSLSSYVEKSVKLALEMAIKEEADLVDNASELLFSMEKGSYQLAILLHGYLREHRKGELSITQFLGNLFQSIDLQGLQDAGRLKIA